TGIAPNILADRLRRLETERIVSATPYSERPPRFAYALTDEGQELAGALRLLADWGSRVSRESEPLRHAACGTPVEARWYCPTCDRPVEGQEAEQVRRV
ncbi:MAG: helix-turn-helix domain-containing protein, partial [Chloroflexota bacterium]